MEKTLSLLNNENGSALFVTLIIMFSATMIGYFATQNTGIELQIAGNQRVYERGFYRADAAAMEAAQRLENVKAGNIQSLRDPSIYPAWMYPKAQTSNLEDLNQWDMDNDGNLELGLFSDIDPTAIGDPNSAFAIAYQGIAPGAQWELGQPSMRVVAIFSAHDPRLMYPPPAPLPEPRQQIFLTTGYMIEY